MVLLPIWGFLVGFTFGANAIFYIAGADHGFFADALAIVSGLVVGVLFAVLSYLYYYFAVILLGGAIGYALGVGVMDFFNLSGAEILTFIVGVVVGGIFAFGFIILAMPAVLAIWGTALGGAVTLVTGCCSSLTASSSRRSTAAWPARSSTRRRCPGCGSSSRSRSPSRVRGSRSRSWAP